MMIAEFFAPPLFSILCVALGVAAFFSPYVFLLAGKEGGEKTLGQVTFSVMVMVFFVVTLGSFVNGFFVGGQVLWVEAYLLMVFLSVYALYYFTRGGHVFRMVLHSLKESFLRFCYLSGMTVLVSLLVQFLILACAQINLIAGAIVFQPLRESVFIVGILLVGGLYFIYKRRDGRDGLVFHHLFWPLVLGLLFFMLPLLLQNFVNSEKFQNSLNATPSLQKV